MAERRSAGFGGGRWWGLLAALAVLAGAACDDGGERAAAGSDAAPADGAPDAIGGPDVDVAAPERDTGPPDDGELPTIIPADEPGPRLTIRGTVVDESGGGAISGATVVVYQTDQSGTYQPSDPDDESTARIRGRFETDADGAFGFRTVQPGEYPGQPPGNRHIHFHSVSAPGYETVGFVLLFEDNVRADVREWAEETGFGVVIPLEGSAATGLEGAVRIALPPTPSTAEAE